MLRAHQHICDLEIGEILLTVKVYLTILASATTAESNVEMTATSGFPIRMMKSQVFHFRKGKWIRDQDNE